MRLVQRYEPTEVGVNIGRRQNFECCAGPGRVNLLRNAFRRGTEHRVCCDLVAVAVRGHHAGGASPGGQLARFRGLWSQLRGPWRCVVNGAVEDGVGAGCDEVSAVVEGLPHVVVHGAGGFRDEPSD